MNTGLFNILLFNVSFIAILLFVRRLLPLLGTVGLPVIPAGTILTGVLIYSSSLIPGILGELSPASVSITSILISLVLLYLLGQANPDQTLQPVSGEEPHGPDEGTKSGPILTFTAGFFSLVGLILVGRYVYRIFTGLFAPQRPLTIDVVVHNLPGFIKFIQDKTLWSMKGPFASYSFGYELIGGFPAYFYRSHWNLYLADLFSVVFYLGVLYYLTDRILRIWRPGVTSRIWPSIAVIWTSWFYLFRPDKLHVGKNDIFLNACILTSFALLLEIVFSESRDLSGKRYYSLLLTSSLASGLALAVKPNALGFVLFLPLVLFAGIVINGKRRGHALLRPALHSAAFLAVTFGTGGFFLFRNLLAYGRLVDPAISRAAFSMAIITNLTDPRFYILNRDTILLPIAVAVFAGLLVKCWRARKSEDRFLFLTLFSAYYLVALISFVLTPFVVFTLGPKGATLDFRQGMMLVTTMLISFLVLSLRERKGSTGGVESESKLMPPDRKVLSSAMGEGSRKNLLNISLLTLFFLVNAVGWYWAQNPTVGMPGYENFKNTPETKVYSYVQNIPGPVRIYSAGLFPYGLYDRKWENEIQFALGTDELIPDETGKKKILDVLQDFKPGYIVISAAHKFPPQPQKNSSKPLHDWMVHNKDCFKEVYSDSGASVFRVLDNCVIISGENEELEH